MWVKVTFSRKVRTFFTKEGLLRQHTLDRSRVDRNHGIVAHRANRSGTSHHNLQRITRHTVLAQENVVGVLIDGITQAVRCTVRLRRGGGSAADSKYLHHAD